MYGYQASASYLAEAPFITKWGFNMMVRRAGSKPFVNAQVWDYFWNFTDPLFDVLASIAPALVPTKNTGILHTVRIHFLIYLDFFQDFIVLSADFTIIFLISNFLKIRQQLLPLKIEKFV